MTSVLAPWVIPALFAPVKQSQVGCNPRNALAAATEAALSTAETA